MNLMKSFLLLTAILFIAVNLTYSQIGYSPKVDSIIGLTTNQIIGLLLRQYSGDTSCIIGGSPYTIISRHYNSASNPKAAQYVLEKFQSYGLTARYQNNSATSVNVIAYKTGIKYPNQQYIICGHYDDMPSGTTAPGCDDNASGTIAVIEAARVLANFNMDYTVVFIAFDEEERGLYGSEAYCDTAYMHGDSIKGVINLDMVAWDGNADNKVNIVYNNPSESFANDFVSAIKTYQLLLNPVKRYSTTANSDHASFWAKGWIAVCHIEDNSDFNPYYHTVNDKYSNIVLGYTTQNVKAAIAYLISLANNYRMNITHTPLNTGNYQTDRTATVVIKSPKTLGTSSNAPRLYYKINSGSFNTVNAFYTNQDTFKFTIPGQSLGTTVSYYIAAQDSAGEIVCTYPSGGRGINPPGTVPPTDLFTYQILNINFVNIGTGSTSSNFPFTTYWIDGRTDMLYLASEITAAGGTAGQQLIKIGFDVITADPGVMNGFKVKIQHTTVTTLSGFTTTGWTNCYEGTYTVPGTGWQYIDLSTPFVWNGTDNLLVEVCYNNSSYTQYSPVKSTTTPNMYWGRYGDLSTADGCQTTSWTSTTAPPGRPNISLVFNAGTHAGNTNTQTPLEYSLSQNYPNPFNPVTKINFTLPKQKFVTLKIYDILGKEISSPVNEIKEAGYYSIDFNASNLSSGVYFYRLSTDEFTDIKRMVLLR